MDENKRNKILLIATIVVVLLTIVSIIFVNSLDDGEKEAPVQAEEIETAYPQEEITDSRIDPQLIRNIVLTNDGSETDGYTYRFEVFVSEDQKELLFTCWYESKDGTISTSSEKINTSRLDDITKIIERYSLAETIKKYREAPGDPTRLVEGGKELEISWYDGDRISLGYPNGAGDALEKYFIELAEWLHTKKY